MDLQFLKDVVNKYPELEAYIDEEEAKKYICDYSSLLFRNEEGKCDCSDPYCPHKGIVSPLGIFFLRRRLESCIKYKKHPLENFCPKNYPIKEFKDINDYRVFTELYYRCMGPFKNLRSGFDVVEGICTKNPLVKKVRYSFNGQEIDVMVVDQMAYCPFPIIIPCIPYTVLSATLLGENDTIIVDSPDTYILGGYLDIEHETLVLRLSTFSRKYDDKIAMHSNGVVSLRSMHNEYLDF